MSKIFRIIHDTANVMMGKDLEEVSEEKTVKVKKSAESSESDNSAKKKDSLLKSEISSEELIDLLDYINSEDLAKDLKDLFRSKKPSANLKCLIDTVNKVLGINISDIPKSTEYKLEYNFVNFNTGEVQNEQGEKLLSTGINVNQLKDFNLTLKVSRVDKATGEKISDGNNEDIKKVENLLMEKFSKGTSEKS